MLLSDKINQNIPKAIQAIQDCGIANGNNEVAEEFESYIASFGANIVQSGLLPTLVFYNNDSGKKHKSSLWLKAIYMMLTISSEGNLIEYVISSCKKQTPSNHNKNPEKVPTYKLDDMDFDKLDDMESTISDIVAALKLAVRTFKLIKTK